MIIRISVFTSIKNLPHITDLGSLLFIDHSLSTYHTNYYFSLEENFKNLTSS